MSSTAKTPLDTILSQTSEDESNNSQKSLVLSLIGLLLFIVLAVFVPFNDEILNTLYPKPVSKASEKLFTDSLEVKIGTATALPEGNSSHALLFARGYLFSIGGRGVSGKNATIYSAKVNEDGGLGSWELNSQLPLRLSFASVVTIDDRIYVIGGSDENDKKSPSIFGSLIQDDGTLGQWIHVGTLPEGFSVESAATFGKILYVTGKQEKEQNKTVVYSTEPSDDGKINNWTLQTALDKNFSEYSIFAFADRLYVVGGADGVGVQKNVYVSLLNTDGKLTSWTQVQALPQGIASYAIATIGERVYVIGGKNEKGEQSANVYQARINIDGSIQNWNQVATLPQPLVNAKAVAVNNFIYIVGGETNGVPQNNTVVLEIPSSSNVLATMASTSDQTKNVNVLVLRYYPLDSSGNYLNSTVTGLNYSLSYARSYVTNVNSAGIIQMTEGSKYHGYNNLSAAPALNYIVVDDREFLKALPPLISGTWSQPDYQKILTEDVNICDYVDNRGVTQVWLWGYHNYPIYPVESNMSMGIASKNYWNHGKYGDVSNSYQIDDMPICNKTYTLYNYNYGRGLGELLEDHGHQIEALFRWAEFDLMQSYISPFGQTTTINRCGWTHSPPNTTKEYYWNGEESMQSDCEDWRPEGGGAVKTVNCHTWYGTTCLDDTGARFKVWWMQNIPGLNNNLSYKGVLLRNWWEVYGDLDTALANGGKTLTKDLPVQLTTVVSDSFNRVDSSNSLGSADTGQKWNAVKGTFGIISNQAYISSGCPAPGFAVIDSGSSDGEWTVTTTTNGQDTLIPFRFVDLNNYYVISARGDSYVLEKKVNGTGSILEFYPQKPASGDVIKIRMSGSYFKVYINGNLVMNANDSSLTSTKHGIGTWCATSVRFDSVSFAAPSDKVTPIPTITPTPTLAPIVTVVSDTFDRADNNASLGSANTGQVWTAVKGVFGIDTNRAYISSGCPAPGYAVIDSGVKDGIVQVSMPIGGQDARVPFRFVDINNHYFVGAAGDGYSLDKVVGGVGARIGFYSTTPVNGDTIKVEMNGSSIKVYINGVQRIAVNDSSILGTKHGIGTWCATSVRFDNFTVSAASNLVTPTPTFTPTPTPSPTNTPTPTKIPTPTPTVTPTPVLDTQPPTAPSNLQASVVSSSQVNLSWGASSDNVAVAGYRVFRNNSLLANVSATVTSYGDGTVLPNTTYTYYVVAYDGAGNTSLASNSRTVTTPSETVTTGTVVGQVRDAVSGAALIGATVTVKIPRDKGKSAIVTTITTNSSGYFAVTLNEGSYDFEVNTSGYSKQTKRVSVVANINTTVHFDLQPNSNKGGKNK